MIGRWVAAGFGALSLLPACGGQTDGGDRTSTGDRASTGGAASTSGGTTSTGGSSTVDAATTGGAGGSLRDGGTDARDPRDASVDASIPDAADAVEDWLSRHDPPCALAPSYQVTPAGTYVLDVNSADDTSQTRDVSYECTGSVVRSRGTLTLTQADGANLVDVDVEIPAIQWSGHFEPTQIVRDGNGWFQVEAVEQNDVDFVAFLASIDPRTAVVRYFSFTYVHNETVSRVLHANGTGWPRCGATEASPPSWIEQPDPIGIGTCGVSTPTSGSCRFSRRQLYTEPPPRCANQPAHGCAAGTCTDTTYGYETTCCDGSP